MAKNFLGRAKSWAAKNELLGPQAFLKYVIFTYLNALNRESNEFVFKGGNLLWTYIRTPRATVDLDLSTFEEEDEGIVKSILQAVTKAEGISFMLETFVPSRQADKHGASVTISYKTDSGASNKFGIDIVFAAPIDVLQISSPIDSEISIKAASLENIVSDKLNALHRFKAGNTRIKDLDDLWRISIRNELRIDAKKLKAILSERKIPSRLEAEWISEEMKKAWVAHRKKYKDLPESLDILFDKVNGWLKAK